jgi:hypothetical protein
MLSDLGAGSILSLQKLRFGSARSATLTQSLHRGRAVVLFRNNAATDVPIWATQGSEPTVDVDGWNVLPGSTAAPIR